jgi:AraC family transcriptional regulator of adaptative response/methylated-DNA-[protein]-cysteine methyltransferase
VTRAVYDAGYGSASRVYESAGARLGMTPAQYGRGGKGMRVGYRIVSTPLGRMLVAGTPRGVCMVSLGDSDAELVAALRDEYPAAEVQVGGPGLASWSAALVRSLRGGAEPPELPLDVRATAFQGRVWRALRAIPCGQTRTYGEIARAIGRPGAARAVGGAVGRNPVGLLIPCHRVISGDGTLGGYGAAPWGGIEAALDLKAALLALEGVVVRRTRRVSPG